MHEEKTKPETFFAETRVGANGGGRVKKFPSKEFPSKEFPSKEFSSKKSPSIDTKIKIVDGSNDWRFSRRGAAVRIFFTCWIIFSAHFATNTVREIYPALSLGDRLSFDVSEYAGLHPDIFTYENRGAFINNNPGASILGAIPYIVFRPVTDRIIARVSASRAANPSSADAASNYDSVYPLAREFYRKSRERGLDVKFGLAAAEMQFFVMSPLTALGVVVVFYAFLYWTKSAKISVFLALLYAFATPVFFRAAQLNQNLLVADFALFAYALLRRFGAPEKKPLYFFAGLCAGWTIVLDYSGAVVILAVSGYALARWIESSKTERNFADLLKFAAGVSLCCAILFAYQWACFGNPFLPAQSYMPQANFTEIGYRGFSFPQMDLLAATAFSMRYGLFTSAPILLAALVFPVWLLKKHRLAATPDTVFFAAFIALFFVFCAANQYGRMQFNTGVRHIVPIVPFVFFLAGDALLKMPRMLAVWLAIPCVYWSWCLAMYRDVELGAGVFEAIKNITLEGFRLPWLTVLQRMNFAENVSPLPVFAVCAALVWALWKVGAKNVASGDF